jgi:hypothetical protein
MTPPHEPESPPSTGFTLLLKVDGRYETARCTSAHDKLWIRLDEQPQDSVRRGHHRLVLCIERALLAPHLRDDVREWEELHAPGSCCATRASTSAARDPGGQPASVPRPRSPARRQPAPTSPRNATPPPMRSASCSSTQRPPVTCPRECGHSRMTKAQLLDEARFAQLRVRYLWRERAQFLDILHAADAERDELRSKLAKYREGASQDEP